MAPALRLLSLSVLAWTLCLSASCATAPYTERSQLILVSEDQARSMGQQAAEQALQEAELSDDAGKVRLVEQVGGKIAAVADRPDYDWEFYTVEAPDTANAFALPGGKVFVYTGIFKYVTSDATLATVMAHEVAHVLVRHGAERLSLSLVSQLGESAAKEALGLQSQAAMQTFDVAYGLASNIGVILPYSRKQELEADKVGLILMAKAGYDPRAAVDFWTAMSRDKGGRAPAFLSTHPASTERIEEIEKFLPQAMEHYRQ